MVGNWLATKADLDVITVEGGGKRADEVRSYRDLWNNGRAIGAGLRRLRLKQGETFGLLMANHAEFVETMVGASATGTVFVPIDPRTKGDKLAYMLKAAHCRGVVATDYALANLLEIKAQLPDLQWIVVLPTDEGKVTEQALQQQGLIPYSELLSSDAAR